MSEERIESRSMNETCDDMDIEVESLSEDNIKIMTLFTNYRKNISRK